MPPNWRSTEGNALRQGLTSRPLRHRHRRMEAILEEPYILLTTDKKDRLWQDLSCLCSSRLPRSRQAPPADHTRKTSRRKALATLVVNRLRGGAQWVAASRPPLR